VSRVQTLAGEFEIADTTLNIPHPYEDGVAKEWIKKHAENFENRESLALAICLSDSNSVIGAVSLMHINTVHQNAELGYWIGKKYWNKGYCTEACMKVLEFGFQGLELHRIYAHHMTRNPASGKVLTKIGMKYEGRVRESIIKWGKFEDIDIYGILKSEFKKIV
jgi:RimJ/RimL family protein N-acetyltransferase